MSQSVERPIPRRVTIVEVLGGRYRPGDRPVNWDKRYEGLDRVRVSSGEELNLRSAGGQSTPDVGWEILLTGAESHPSGEIVHTWTLYGLKKSDALSVQTTEEASASGELH